jgi:TRAP-type C4-dicarboxylate transport system permease small subunit
MIRFSDALDKVAMVLSGIAIVVLVGAVMLQVVARYVFSQPPAYTEELARYAMIWAGLIGASMSFKRRFDPALFNGINRGPVWIKIGARLIKSVVVLIYLLPILWYVFFGPGMNPARGFLLRHSRTMADALPFSTVWVAIAVPLMIVFILVHLVARWSGDDRPAHPDTDQ